MTPEAQKAKELVEKFKQWSNYNQHDLSTKAEQESSNTSTAIECALICVDEILELDVWDWHHNAEYSKLFWQKIKAEINKL